MITLQIIAMILIAIAALFLMCYLLERLYWSELPAWFSAVLVLLTSIFCVGASIALECFLYYRWFA